MTEPDWDHCTEYEVAWIYCNEWQTLSTSKVYALECLDQAVLVAQKHPFDQKKVSKWCKDEGAETVYKEFEAKLM